MQRFRFHLVNKGRWTDSIIPVKDNHYVRGSRSQMNLLAWVTKAEFFQYKKLCTVVNVPLLLLEG